jgi:two-component system sensor histidine kinase/response regulator
MTTSERILVVDDDPRNVRLLEGIFRTAGYAVDRAHSGAEALDLIARTPPDLILLDVMMPGMSGHDVCVRLKKDEKTRPIPVVLVTSLSSTEDKVEGLDLGADDFVSKPVNRLELLAKTRSLLRIKTLHDEVTRAKEELEGKNRELLRLEQLKESLVQMIVHDLKNPLTAIMGNLTLVLQSPDASREKTTHRAGVALESTRIMMRMILDLLDISRLEESHMTLNREAVSLGAVAATCLTENGGLVTRASIQLKEEFPPGLPEAWVDRGLIDRVVANLLSNAIKHTPEGGTITVGARRNAAEDTLEFYVTDTGEGIAEAYHLVIFEKFCQADAKKYGLKTDRGLGLTFCKMAVEAHGGRIWVTSAPGKGSTFTISLPIAMPVDVAAGNGCSEEREVAGSRRARR